MYFGQVSNEFEALPPSYAVTQRPNFQYSLFANKGHAPEPSSGQKAMKPKRQDTGPVMSC